MIVKYNFVLVLAIAIARSPVNNCSLQIIPYPDPGACLRLFLLRNYYDNRKNSSLRYVRRGRQHTIEVAFALGALGKWQDLAPTYSINQDLLQFQC